MIETKKIIGRPRAGKIKNCLICNTEFYVRLSKINQKYCSKKCQPPSKKRLARIRKNCLVCNKEIFVLASLFKRKKFCSRSCLAKFKSSGEKNNNWKGDKVGYYSLHNWIKRHYGKPNKCERIGCTGKSKRYQWGNISGEYKRERTDWQQVCNSCNQLDEVHIPMRFNYLLIQRDIDKK